jgi:hypothetical protein
MDELQGEPDRDHVPPALAGHAVIDAHTHAFPAEVFAAIWRWFARNAWPIRYQQPAPETARYLLDRGVGRVVALPYAHVPGLARRLNQFVVDLARDEPRVVPCATVYPGEDGARAILDEALGPLGCRGVKIHCHVQRLAPDDPRLDEVYDAAAAHGVPVVIHAGDAPSLPAEQEAVAARCRPEALAAALRRHPRTAVIVPHLGAERMEETAALLDRHEHLHLDTTMTLAGFFPLDATSHAADARQAAAWRDRAAGVVRAAPERILYGSDFPHVPYPWDRELESLARLGLPAAALRLILHDNAVRLFHLEALG